MIPWRAVLRRLRGAPPPSHEDDLARELAFHQDMKQRDFEQQGLPPEDARFAARRLRNRPVYTLLAVLTLALGIGGSAAVFGVARPLMLDPLPYAHADEVGSLWMPGWWTEEEFLFLRGRIPGFRQVAAHRRPVDRPRGEGDRRAQPDRRDPGPRPRQAGGDADGAP